VCKTYLALKILALNFVGNDYRDSILAMMGKQNAREIIVCQVNLTCDFLGRVSVKDEDAAATLLFELACRNKPGVAAGANGEQTKKGDWRRQSFVVIS
jgi:hypothetical protein